MLRPDQDPKAPLKALRGAGQGEGLLDRLLQSRREDREHEAEALRYKPATPRSASIASPYE